MREQKIDKVKLSTMLRTKSQRECAKHFGVSEAAISKARKSISLSVCKSVALENAHKVLNHQLDVVGQMERINKDANSLLDDLKKKVKENSPGRAKGQAMELYLKTIAELRNQAKLQMELLKELYNVERIQKFQQAVLETIAGVEPKVRDEIVRRLIAGDSLRRAIGRS